MIKRKLLSVVGVAIATGAIALSAGCQSQYNDQNSVQQVSPDFIVTYLNVDGFANVTLLCIDGVGFATTSRDYTSLIPVTGWNAFCATKAKSPDKATRASVPNT